MTSDDLSLHGFLLRMAIEGLWQMRTKHPALVGYIPDSETVPVIRLYLMGRRELPFGNFTAAVSKYPGYMESGRDSSAATGTCRWPTGSTHVLSLPFGLQQRKAFPS